MANIENSSDLKVLYEHVLDAASRISGDRAKAMRWCEQERLELFDWKTAKELVAEGRGADVLRYLRSVDAGPAG